MAARVAGSVVVAIAVGSIDVVGIVVLAALPARTTVLLEVVVQRWLVMSIGIIWLCIGCSGILIGISVTRSRREGLLLLSVICATTTRICTVIVVLLSLRR